MRKLLLVLLWLVSLPLYASHIVGGEIELLHISGSQYRINLIYYFDVRNNPRRDPFIEEPTIDVFIYRKLDNVRMSTITLNWVNKVRVPYTQPDCSSGEIISDKITYSQVVNLPGSVYNQELGYYIVWARCCRNYTIFNIISEDPNHGGTGAGQTFYLEFPPVVKNGTAFRNSSPRNFPALNDYACPTKPYYVDFAGVDDDGDSLVYSLTTPLSTVSATPVPPATPAPYPLVQWRTPMFGLDRIVNGSPPSTDFPDLHISTDGFLRVTPRSLGLYVFAVRVEEYRNKKKIGETRRDFQMLVTDCRLSAPPSIIGKKLNDVSFTDNNLSVKFSNTVSNDDRCVVVSVSDPDSNREADGFKEVIKLKVVPLNFKTKSINTITFSESTAILERNASKEFRICFPQCPFFEGGPYQVGIIAFDDACSLPLSDTLKVEVDVEQPHNERPQFVAPDHVTATLDEGTKSSWPFEVHDADADELTFFVATSGFALSTAGMKTTVTSNTNGVLKGVLEWDAFCNIYDFTRRTAFDLQLIVDDLDVCKVNPPDTAYYKLAVKLPPNAIPTIDTDLTPDPAEIAVKGLERKVFSQLGFKVTGTDVVDDALVSLRMVGKGFNPANYGMSFAKASAKGTVSSNFLWDIQCANVDLKSRSEFTLAFVAIDSAGSCRQFQTDSVTVTVKVLKPDNSPPQLSIVKATGGFYEEGQTLESRPGAPISLQFNLRDTDAAPRDQLFISMIEAKGTYLPEGYTYTNAVGPSVLSSTFFWQPDCSIFREDVYENDYYFDFRYGDDRCFSLYTDTIRVQVKIKDDQSKEFAGEPVNAFTPNGDDLNEFFAMQRRDEHGELVSILPPDNCLGHFLHVKIYNRWGKQVFTSSDRDFRWYGEDTSNGVYYYYVTYTNGEYKGTVSLVK